MQTYTARIAQVSQATPTIKALLLEVDDPTFKYLPGQWIEVSVEIADEKKTCAYSVTSSPINHGPVGLAIKSSAAHAVTQWLYQAQAGDIIEITRGQGPFVFVPGMGEDIVLLGGGVGVTPLLSIWRYVRDACPETHATLYYSVSHPDEILFREELQQSARHHSHISLEITVTRPCASWQGQTGRIDQAKLAALNAPPNALFYLCGPPGMVDDLVRSLRALGVHPSRMIFEKWW